MTNFEKIKQMSVEEMATAIVILLAAHLNRWNVVNGSKEQYLTSAEMEMLIKKWIKKLESEVQEDE